MAELAALDMKLNVYPEKYYATYTQGTPRPGDQGFADLYNSAISASFREIHQADIVPHLPPKLLGFIHGPTEIWFNENWSHYKNCSGSNGEDTTCSDSIFAPISIHDHIYYRGINVGAYCTDSASASAGGKAVLAEKVQLPIATQIFTNKAQAIKEEAEKKKQKQQAKKQKQQQKHGKRRVVLKKEQ